MEIIAYCCMFPQCIWNKAIPGEWAAARVLLLQPLFYWVPCHLLLCHVLEPTHHLCVAVAKTLLDNSSSLLPMHSRFSPGGARDFHRDVSALALFGPSTDVRAGQQIAGREDKVRQVWLGRQQGSGLDACWRQDVEGTMAFSLITQRRRWRRRWRWWWWWWWWWRWWGWWWWWWRWWGWWWWWWWWWWGRWLVMMLTTDTRSDMMSDTIIAKWWQWWW